MKKISSFLFILYCSLFLSSCNTATPEKYFDVAVLNSNYVVGFAGNSLSREFQSPSATMGEDGQPVPMKRIKAVEDKIQFCEAALSKMNGLTKTDDARDILECANALYNFVIPVYKNEYTELAKLYDDAAPKDKIEAMDAAIKIKYAPKFETLYNELIAKGKLYAARHNISVNWAM